MKERPKIDLGLTGFDELFMTEQERHLNQLPKIHDIPLELIDDFPDHPYKVRMDEDMMQLIESVKERGVIVPVALRQKEDGRYELISGHRRKKACEIAGFETVRADILDMTRDEAIIYEQKIKRYMLMVKGCDYCLFPKYEQATDIVYHVRSILKKYHMYVNSTPELDIEICRKKFELFLNQGEIYI